MASLYPNLIRPVLFKLNPESAHNLSIQSLKWVAALRVPLWLLERSCRPQSREQIRIWDLSFSNPVGLAAGMDKDAEAMEGMFAMGFSFVEVGTVTPLPQPGNPKPRLFRYPDRHAIVNRMGFNNAGVEALAKKVGHLRSSGKKHGIIGINIGKQKSTPNANATEDYVKGFQAVADLADYIAVNISSPNTPNLRELQEVGPLKELLGELRSLNQARENSGKRPVPLLLKIAPDLSEGQVEQIVGLIMEHSWDGIIATNTTIDREGANVGFESPGGLSGKPLRERSTEVVGQIHKFSGGRLPVIGVGGIETADDAKRKLDAGARLVQVYSGFIYQGPGMVKSIVRNL